MGKTYTVTFNSDKRVLPGVLAVGTIQRGGSADVPAAEAVRLVDRKGLAFASATDEKAARAELAAAADPAPAATPAPVTGADASTDTEEK